MTMKNVYDLAVIGAGPAGIVGATTAASLGARVVLIDRFGDLGGAGANTGTVSSKTLRETALALSGIGSSKVAFCRPYKKGPAPTNWSDPPFGLDPPT